MVRKLLSISFVMILTGCNFQMGSSVVSAKRRISCPTVSKAAIKPTIQNTGSCEVSGIKYANATVFSPSVERGEREEVLEDPQFGAIKIKTVSHNTEGYRSMVSAREFQEAYDYTEYDVGILDNKGRVIQGLGETFSKAVSNAMEKCK